MFRKLSISGWKFFAAGEGISAATGRDFGLAAIVGALVGFVAVAFYWMTEAGRHYILEEIGHHRSLLPSGEAAHSIFAVETFTEPRRWLLLFLPAIGAAAGALLIRWLSNSRHARGTDSAVYSYHHLGGEIPASVLPVKSVASVLTVGSGGSAGYEGPMTLLGAACGAALARMLRLDARLKRMLMAAGLAAGIGALFRAPLAGAIFGAEIFYSSSDMEYETILPGFVASAMAYTVFAGFFGWQPLFAMPNYTFENGMKLLPYVALAFVVALGARFYISFFRGTEERFSRIRMPSWEKAAIGGLVTGLFGFFFPDILGTGYGIIQNAFSTHDASAFVLEATRDLPFYGFLLFFFMKVIATCFTVGSGGSGGVFAPALVAGGSLGAACGIFFARVLPDSMAVHPGAFALVGMAGFIAAAIRIPLTAIVMVSEISGNHELLLPTMWTCGIAFWLNNGWSLYRSQVHDREASPIHG